MKILVVEKDTNLAALIAFTLTQAAYETYVAADRSAALRSLELERPRLALLGHNASELDGYELCRDLRGRCRIPIMVLSAQDREDDVIAAFEAGADEFLRKPFSPRVLVARVRALLRRTEDVSATLLTAARMRLALDESTLQIGDAPRIRLTPHELAAMHLLMSNPNRTVTSERLLRYVWGDASRATPRMLKQLIYRLRQKVEARPSAPQLIVTTPNAGYRLVANPSNDQPPPST